MFHIALHEPQIAPNTGNIIRLSANNGCQLHIIEPTGFDFEDKKLRRAGLDYRDIYNIRHHANYEVFLQHMQGSKIYACTTKAKRHYHDVQYQAGDVLLFGSETSGLPKEILESLNAEQLIRIPMQAGCRSINLANAVSIISYEAWRQNDFATKTG
jgi:tRNA (cytidine/uridine-2'-O-)-methyltransferase